MSVQGLTMTVQMMELRDHFAAAAVQGAVEKQVSDTLLAKFDGDAIAVSDAIAQASYMIADAMMRERTQRPLTR